MSYTLNPERFPFVDQMLREHGSGAIHHLMSQSAWPREAAENHVAAALQRQQAAKASTVPTAVLEQPEPPVWETPSHEEIPLHELSTDNLDILNSDDDARLFDNIIEARRKHEAESVKQPSTAQPTTTADPLPLVPAELKVKRNWVRWQLEPVNGRLTKVPYQVNGHKASSTDPSTWNKFEDVVRGAVINETQGVGIMTDGSFVGFDLDGCRNPATGEIAEWAKRIINSLGTYTEITPSGFGVRVYVNGQLPDGARRFSIATSAGFGDKVGIEVYYGTRYFTVTGSRLGELCTLESPNVLAAYELCRTVSREFPSEKRKNAASFGATDSNSTVVFTQAPGSLASKLSVLMYGEIVSRSPFIVKDSTGSNVEAPSQSEADMSLATLLAIKHGDNPELIDADFRESSLYRSKWDRLAESTIKKAIASAKNREQTQQTVAQPGVRPAPLEFLSQEEVDAIVDSDEEYPVIPLINQVGPEWNDDVMYGIVGDIVRKISRYCEAHPAGIYLDLLVSLGSIIGRGPYFNIGSSQHYTNEFVVRVGSTSTARKGTGRDAVDELIRLVDPEWYARKVLSGFGSAEAIVNEIRDVTVQQVRAKGGFKPITVPGSPDKRLFIREGEIASVFLLAGKKESRADVVLRDGWDGKPLRNLVKGKGSDGISNSAFCQEPHISISGDSTRSELMSKLPPGSGDNGFANRFLYCYVARTKLCPHGGPMLDWSQEVVQLHKIIQLARGVKYVPLFPGSAEKAWTRMYLELEKEITNLPGVCPQLCARAAAHIRRLALILALLDECDAVYVDHLRAAKRLWDYCQESVRFIFQDMTSEQDRIVQFVQNKGGATMAEIREELFQRHKKVDWIKAQIDALVHLRKLDQQGEKLVAM